MHRQKIENSTVLITGGSSGIGRELALELVKNNTVIVCGRDQEKLEALQTLDPRLIIRQCDITEQQQSASLIGWITSEFEHFDLLINNAGSRICVDLAVDAEQSQTASAELQMNFLSHVALIERVLPHFKRQRQAKIINVTTGLVYLPKASIAFYCAAKAALHSYTQSLRIQLKNTNIQVVEMQPPLVDTEFHKGTLPKTVRAMSAVDVMKTTMRGLEYRREEIPVGMSKMAKVLAHYAPTQGLKLINK